VIKFRLHEGLSKQHAGSIPDSNSNTSRQAMGRSAHIQSTAALGKEHCLKWVSRGCAKSTSPGAREGSPAQKSVPAATHNGTFCPYTRLCSQSFPACSVSSETRRALLTLDMGMAHQGCRSKTLRKAFLFLAKTVGRC
jgi:hypothetical protein